MKATDFLCGLFAGWSQVIVGQPLDFIKVRIQTATNDASVSFIAKDIKQKFGIKGFYRGSSSLFFGFAFTIGTQFLVFQWAKKLIFRSNRERQNMEYSLSKLKIWEVAVTGAFAGWSVSAIYCPVQYVKIQKQLGDNISRSSLAILFKQLKQNGMRNILKGYWSTVARETIGSFFYFGSYETLVRSLAKEGRQNASTMDFFLAGGLAGMTFHLLTYPIDTIKTNIQAGESLKRAAYAAFQYSKLKGYNIVLTRAAAINSSSFLVYEKSQQYFSRWNFYLYSVY